VSKKVRKLIVYLLLLFVPFVILSSPQANFKSFRVCIVELTSSPMRLILFPFKEFKKILLYHNTYDKYQQLQEDYDQLRSEFIVQEEALKENQRLKGLLDFKSKVNIPTIAANVIGRDPANWNAVLYIDKGKWHGVKVGMPVVTPGGIVGRVLATGAQISKIMLISDPNFSVGAVNERSRESGVVSGTLKSVCRMRYLGEQADIQVGDKVITSKLSSFFPEGMLIGEVVDVFKSPSSPMLECLIQPAVSLSQIEEVLILKK